MKFFYIIIILAVTANSDFAAEKYPYGDITINNANLWERDERHYVVKHFTPQVAKTFSLVSKDAYECVQLRGHIKIKHSVTRENVIIFLKSNGSFIKSLDLTNVYIDQEYLEHLLDNCTQLKRVTLRPFAADMKPLIDKGIQVIRSPIKPEYSSYNRYQIYTVDGVTRDGDYYFSFQAAPLNDRFLNRIRY